MKRRRTYLLGLLHYVHALRQAGHRWASVATKLNAAGRQLRGPGTRPWTRDSLKSWWRRNAAPRPAIARPKTLADCANGPRPCPWVSCRYHLYLHVDDHGRLYSQHPGRGPLDLKHTCAMDIARFGLERDGARERKEAEVPLAVVGSLIGLGKETTRKIEARALDKVREGLEV